MRRYDARRKWEKGLDDWVRGLDGEGVPGSLTAMTEPPDDSYTTITHAEHKVSTQRQC